MIGSITTVIQDAMLRLFRLPELVTVFISVLPIVEARGAIPIGIDYGIHPLLAMLYAFLGSSLMAPILIAVLLPFVKWMARTKLFAKIGQTLYEKFEQKSSKIVAAENATEINAAEGAAEKRKSDFRKMLGIFAFVAVPLPLTGVWTGSAVAALTRLPYGKALLSVVAGNLVASAILTLLFAFLPAAVRRYVILGIGIAAIVVVIALIVKIILHKPAVPAAATETKKEND